MQGTTNEARIAAEKATKAAQRACQEVQDVKADIKQLQDKGERFEAEMTEMKAKLNHTMPQPIASPINKADDNGARELQII
eukprot:982188-Karenia_brevis.AAC.1